MHMRILNLACYVALTEYSCWPIFKPCRMPYADLNSPTTVVSIACACNLILDRGWDMQLMVSFQWDLVDSNSGNHQQIFVTVALPLSLTSTASSWVCNESFNLVPSWHCSNFVYDRHISSILSAHYVRIMKWRTVRSWKVPQGGANNRGVRIAIFEIELNTNWIVPEANWIEYFLNSFWVMNIRYYN